MKGIVINLDSRPDRLKSFKENKFPFEVERFPGVVAANGEDGCTLSHLAVLHQIRQEKAYPVTVFEDDCVLVEPWDLVEKAISQLPKDWDALWLGANPRSKLQRYSDNLYHLKNAYCLHAVIYNSKKMIEYILKKHNTISGKNLDIFYREDVQKRFNCFITYPIAATQLSDRSDIAPCVTNNYQEILNNYNKAVK